MTKAPETPVVQQDLVPILIWIGTFGKLLIRKKVLTKDEFIAELTSLKEAIPHLETKMEIDVMISTVRGW